jgi:3-dehydroquinate synthase
MKTISVPLKAIDSRLYKIYLDSGLLSQPDFMREIMQSFNAGKQVAIVTNPQIAEHYLPSLQESLSNYEVLPVILPEGEAHKNIDSVMSIFHQLSNAEFNRSCTLLALGGGVIGDITGYAAATWMRGVNFVQLPTTLLAQVDSSVGGKTGVNIPQGKNMIGAFYHPRAVITDLNTLHTLPAREFKAGLAEVIKYGLIYDEQFLTWLEKNIDKLIDLDKQSLIYAIQRSCEIKAEVVAQDEKEQGLRAILNLGHTFGHAIEAAMGYGKWLHGEAISAGMVMAAKLSYELGWIKSTDLERVQAIFQQTGLPIEGPKNLSYEDYWQRMVKDKKSRDEGLPLVLLKSLGKAVVSYDYTEQRLRKILPK